MSWDAWSGLPGGNARFLAGMSFESATKTRRLESRRCRLEARSTYPCVPVRSDWSMFALEDHALRLDTIALEHGRAGKQRNHTNCQAGDRQDRREPHSTVHRQPR